MYCVEIKFAFSTGIGIVQQAYVNIAVHKSMPQVALAYIDIWLNLTLVTTTNSGVKWIHCNKVQWAEFKPNIFIRL